MKILKQGAAAVVAVIGLSVGAGQVRAEIDFQSLLKEGLLGAGVGAISAGASKGNAGTGALIGAGTNIIGGSLLSFLTGTSSTTTTRRAVYAQPVYSQPVYAAPQPQPAPTYTYTQPQVTYTQPVTRVEPVYAYAQPTAPAPAYDYDYAYAPPQEDLSKKIIKQGLLGAGVGALSAGASNGNAGTGALVGAGTTVIGGALLDFLTGPSASSSAVQPNYYYSSPKPAAHAFSQPVQRRIVRTFDANGHVISEEEFWQ